jgi:type II secretory pathway component PulF
MTFTYQGKGVSGESREGSVEAASRSEALRLLARDKIQPLRLVLRDEVAGPVIRASPQADRPVSGSVRLSQAQIILFTDELGELLHSGLQLEPALQLTERREEKPSLRWRGRRCATASVFPRR